MAGKPGRSGGRRQGAGRKPQAPDTSVETDDPLAFLISVMQGKVVPSAAQLKAAQTAAKFFHAPKTAVGKKEGKNEAAKEVAGGRFAQGRAPRLATVNGRKVKGG